MSSTPGDVKGSPVNMMPAASRTVTIFAMTDVLPSGIPSDAFKALQRSMTNLSPLGEVSRRNAEQGARRPDLAA